MRDYLPVWSFESACSIPPSSSPPSSSIHPFFHDLERFEDSFELLEVIRSLFDEEIEV
jgi:hypothetical protein